MIVSQVALSLQQVLSNIRAARVLLTQTLTAKLTRIVTLRKYKFTRTFGGGDDSRSSNCSSGTVLVFIFTTSENVLV